MKKVVEKGVAEFTLKAVVTGIILGVIFGSANAYLGLRVGMTVSASIPAAVMTVALFKLMKAENPLLEANISQTIASASTALATGTIFTIPALFMWGVVPPYWQVVALCFLGGVLGISAMIPLRRLLIVDSAAELPYPEGTACAEVLRATASGMSGGKWIFYGLGLGAFIKILLSVVFLSPAVISLDLSFLPRAQLALEIAPALIAVGYILGYRYSGILLAGSLLSAVVIIPMIYYFGMNLTVPLLPSTSDLISTMSADDIWSKYIRYIGAGAVAFAGIVTVIVSIPTMYRAFMAVSRGIGKHIGERNSAPVVVERTDRDVPPTFIIAGILFVVCVAALVPGIFSGDLHFGARLVCAGGVAIFGFLFVTVAARIVGLVGVSSQPTSGIAIATIMGTSGLFLLFGWTDASAKIAVLTTGTIVAIAASKAGDISQDLKTGFLVGATPAKQQFGQLIGAAFACWSVAATVLLLGSTYAFGTKELPAPQATLMKTIVEGVLAGTMPWDLVFMGSGISAMIMLCGISGLAFAVGVYLPISLNMSIFLGGCLRALVNHGRKNSPKSALSDDADPGVLAASGLVAGEGLAGVLIAGLVALGLVPKSMDPRLGGLVGDCASLLIAAVTCWFIYRATRKKSKNA